MIRFGARGDRQRDGVDEEQLRCPPRCRHQQRLHDDGGGGRCRDPLLLLLLLLRRRRRRCVCAVAGGVELRFLCRRRWRRDRNGHGARAAVLEVALVEVLVSESRQVVRGGVVAQHAVGIAGKEKNLPVAGYRADEFRLALLNVRVRPESRIQRLSDRVHFLIRVANVNADVNENEHVNLNVNTNEYASEDEHMYKCLNATSATNVQLF